MKVLSTILLIFLISSTNALHQMMQKLKNSSKFSGKIDTLVIIGDLLLQTYEPAFVAGVLGNIYHEGSIGKFESSNYVSHPEAKPQYLKYMDSLYDYRNKYSGRIITNVSLRDVFKLLKQLKADNWQKGKFGLGCVQWTGSRTYTLVETYNAECNNCDRITLDQATAAEGKMIIKELKGSHVNVYNTWKNENSNKNTASAAYSAGYYVCKKYEIPADTENRAKQRGNTAKEIYAVMTG